MTAAPETPVDVVVTSNDPGIVTVSTDPNAEGGEQATFFGVTSATAGTVYVQGREIGSASLTVSADGFFLRISAVQVDPSGFGIVDPASISTSLFSGDSSVQLTSSRLNPATLLRETDQPVRGGFTPSVAVTSSDTSVGTITVSPLAFDSGVTSRSTAFHPLAIGTTVLSVVQPDGFTNPAAGGQITATVNPDINLPVATVGKNLQMPVQVSLTAAPSEPVDVVVTSSDLGRVTVSLDPNGEGASSVTFTGVTSLVAGTVYVQGRELGSASLTASAAGYNAKTSGVQVNPSAFLVIYPRLTTSVTAPDTALQVISSRLARGLCARDRPARARRLHASVAVTSSDTSVE